MADFNLFDTDVDLMSPQSVTKTETHEKETQEGKRLLGDNAVVETIEELEKITPPAKDDVNEEKVDKNIKTKTPETGAKSTSSPYSTLAKALYEEGVLTNFDEEEYKGLVEELGEAGAIIELNKRTIVDQIEAYKNNLTEEQRDVLEAIEKGVSLDQYVNLKARSIEYNKIDTDQLGDNDELCKQLIKDDLRLKGFSDSEISEQIEDIENLGKLEARGKKSLATLKENQKQNADKLKREAEDRRKLYEESNRKQLKDLEMRINATSEIIPGNKINAQTKTKIFETITQPVAEMQDGRQVNAIWAKRAENPVDFDIKMAYLLNAGIFDGKWDKLTTTAKSNAIQELDAAIKSQGVIKSGGENRMEPSQDAKSILDSMRRTKWKT